MNTMRTSSQSPLKIALWALGLLFVGSILWSMWVDTLRPLLRAGDARGVAMHLAGLPLILAGTGAIVWGGTRFVRDTFRARAAPEMRAGVATMWEGTAEEARAARWHNLRMLLGAWKSGALLIAAGFALIALGSYLINL